MKKLKKIILFFVSIILISNMILLGIMAIKEKNYILFIPLLCITFIIICLIYFLIVEFIGYKEYRYYNETLIISRKEKKLAEISKMNITNIIKELDSLTDKLLAIKFFYNGKKYNIRITADNEIYINQFIEDLSYNIKKIYRIIL